MNRLKCEDIFSIIDKNEKLSKLPDSILGNTIYCLKLNADSKNAWKADKLKWDQYSTADMKGKFTCRYYSSAQKSATKLESDQKLTKKVYTLETDPLTIIVQYLGDVKLGVPSNHRRAGHMARTSTSDILTMDSSEPSSSMTTVISLDENEVTTAQHS
ncbi:unnamed protein product [Didymodactylos carnosus]|uniref:Uncharacterized protein n=1 Tax=Didymodactylos carnosus TaxID=1234261 RepID=A0A815HVE0_9BILA|nr:unnamed protein product [Didymodactylos carnosus]CAF4229115.1 unnamed protein product [Didymodactylos carnosus]